MTDQNNNELTMPGKIKFAYFILTLLTMGSFSMSAIMLSEKQYSLSVLFVVLAVLLVGGGFSVKKRFLK